MSQKQIRLKSKGMQRDLSVSVFNPEYSYENMNVRIMPTNESTLLSVINEKGNKDVGFNINGITIGSSVLDDELILFASKNINHISDVTSAYYLNTFKDIADIRRSLDRDIFDNSTDSIYKFWYENNTLKSKLLYTGDLGFNASNPIETLCFYENNNIKKVYWVDGLNQPRVINIAAKDDVINSWTNNSFNFLKKMKLEENVVVKKVFSGGVFPAGVIQYCFTYFDDFGQESNIFHTTPLYYTSFNDRGGSPEESTSNSFIFNLTNLSSEYKNIRCYSIFRTSIDATPTCRIVGDYQITKEQSFVVKEVHQTQARTGVDYSDVYIIDSNGMRRSLDTSHRTYIDSNSNIVSSRPYFGAAMYTLASDFAWQIDRIVFPENLYTMTPGIGGQYLISEKIVKGRTLDLIIANRENLFDYTYIDKNIVSFIDTGSIGTIIDPTQLLYVGGEEIIAGTISQKDNTMFLGDINIKRSYIPDSVKIGIRGSASGGGLSYKTKYIDRPDASGLYPYYNSLKGSSAEIKHLKYLETYRFGVQFQHETGRWSEVCYIDDVYINKKINTAYDSRNNPVYNEIPFPVINIFKPIELNTLASLGYVKARGVIVYPDVNERNVVLQGIANPTVFNVGDRNSNSPFSQASWFARPNLPCDISISQNDNRDLYNINKNSAYSRSYTISSSYSQISDVDFEDPLQKNKYTFGGRVLESIHYKQIPANDRLNSEIQCLRGMKDDGSGVFEFSGPYYFNDGANDRYDFWAKNHSEYYFVDQSIITINSPDIEFDDSLSSLDLSSLKMRIIGMVPLTSNSGDINITTLTAGVTPNEAFRKFSIGYDNVDLSAGRVLGSGTFYSGMDDLDSAGFGQGYYGFVVYPFHANRSLSARATTAAMLDKKVISNIRYSYNSIYFSADDNLIYYPPRGIQTPVLFNQEEQSVIKVKSPQNSNLNDFYYYGNVDKVLNYTPVAASNPLWNELNNNRTSGYPLIMNDPNTLGLNKTVSSYEDVFKCNYIHRGRSINGNPKFDFGTEPVRIRYKSCPHMVVALNYISDVEQVVMPTITDKTPLSGLVHKVNPVQNTANDYFYPFWMRDKKLYIHQDSLDINNTYHKDYTDMARFAYNVTKHYFWLVELVRDNNTNIFGGTSDNAINANTWHVAGESVSLFYSNGTIKDSIDIPYTEGDTYYQRYDCMKTYPYSDSDQNQIIDIVSFMCETKVNLDGRYDKNRGLNSNLSANKTNFNLINKVYSQKDNFFVYRALDLSRYELSEFKNIVTWTKTKTAGELIDSWTNITLASTLDLDGDKGSVRAIRKFNNELIVFQDKAISNILYNSRTQIASSNGIPIEIANSGKVDGKRYITNQVGCSNKWSIQETSRGIYFIDDITRGIYLFNGQIDDISDRLGFHSWINSRINEVNIWNPKDFNGFITHYDKTNGDIFFTTKKECLCFSEPLGQFVSFYSYDNMSFLSVIKDKAIAVRRKKDFSGDGIWIQHEGEYNMFFGEYKPFYINYIVNPESHLNKTFNNMSFRSDTWDGENLLDNITFDKVEFYNEYQNNVININLNNGIKSNLKKKFRVWRLNIPRASSNRRDRLINQWLNIKMSMESQNNYKTILHDVVVSYY